MAGIVAQITKANWERKKNRSKHISADKSNYYIAPFDASYDPEKHNNYIKRKKNREEAERERQRLIGEAMARIKERQEREAAEEARIEEETREVRELVEEIAAVAKQEEEKNIRLRCTKAIMGAFVLAVPTAIFVFLIVTFWGVDTGGVLESEDSGGGTKENSGFS